MVSGTLETVSCRHSTHPERCGLHIATLCVRTLAVMDSGHACLRSIRVFEGRWVHPTGYALLPFLSLEMAGTMQTVHLLKKLSPTLHPSCFLACLASIVSAA